MSTNIIIQNQIETFKKHGYSVDIPQCRLKESGRPLWCRNNIGQYLKDWYAEMTLDLNSGTIYYFIKAEDAIMFKLIFG